MIGDDIKNMNITIAYISTNNHLNNISMYKRIQKTALFLCLVALALTFQGCPGKNPPQDTTRFGYIYAPKDSTVVRFYWSKDNGIYEDFEYICPPNSPEVYSQVAWFCPEKYHEITYDEELHNLHVRRLSEEGPCYVLLSRGVKINGTFYGWANFYTPAIENIVNGDTIYRHVPVPIEQVIDTLQRQEPQRVVEIKGLQEQSIYSHFSFGDLPELTFSEEDLLPRTPLVASDN